MNSAHSTFYSRIDQWFLVMSTQLIGFSMAGLCHSILVVPASMIWPENLVYCALLNTLHTMDYGVGERGSMSRKRFFMYVLIGGGIYYLLPG